MLLFLVCYTGRMGTFSVAMQITNLVGQQFQTMDALVDTGSTMTSIAADVLDQLGIKPEGKRRFRLGDDSVIEYPIGSARINIQNIKCTVTIAFLPTGAEPLIGATTLELMGLAVDPIGQKLYSIDLLLK